MRKRIAFVLVLVCVLGLAACSNNSMNHIIKTKPSVTGIVQEVYNDYVIMHSDTADGYPNGSDWQISLNVENKDSYTDLAVGDEIVAYHDGNVMETDPLKVGTVYAITLKTPADRTRNDKSVFETDNITGVTFYGSAPNSTDTEVPSEHLAEITEWLGTFVAGKKADDVLPPGADSLFVRIEYSDGRIVENSMSTFVLDGTTYLIDYAKEPECYFELFAD